MSLLRSSIMRFLTSFGMFVLGTLTMLFVATTFSQAEYLLISRIFDMPGPRAAIGLVGVVVGVGLLPPPTSSITGRPCEVDVEAGEFVDPDFLFFSALFEAVSWACFGCDCFERKLGNFGIENFPDFRVSPILNYYSFLISSIFNSLKSQYLII